MDIENYKKDLELKLFNQKNISNHHKKKQKNLVKAR